MKQSCGLYSRPWASHVNNILAFSTICSFSFYFNHFENISFHSPNEEKKTNGKIKCGHKSSIVLRMIFKMNWNIKKWISCKVVREKYWNQANCVTRNFILIILQNTNTQTHDNEIKTNLQNDSNLES